MKDLSAYYLDRAAACRRSFQHVRQLPGFADLAARHRRQWAYCVNMARWSRLTDGGFIPDHHDFRVNPEVWLIDWLPGRKWFINR